MSNQKRGLLLPANTPDWVKALLVFLTLYMFLVGIGSMSSAFKLMGKGFAEGILSGNPHPLVALFIGILATTLIQSSSTTTSLVVGGVAGGVIEFETAIFMVMGANVGTTVTNTIVSLGHITRSEEYKRAFAAATVHDFFNLLVLLILFPLEYYTGFLTVLADAVMGGFNDVGATKLSSPIKLITKPAVGLLKSMVFGSGPALAIVGVTMTFIALLSLVKLLRSLMISRLENLFDRTVFRTPLLSLMFGLILTMIVQSSSITTSVAVPLVGAGILTIKQVFPFTMGANIGTTMTAVIAALAAMSINEGGAKDMVALRVAFHHVMFNVVGVAMLWFLRGIPIWIATKFAELATWNRLFPLIYIIVTFYVIPFLVVWLGR